MTEQAKKYLSDISLAIDKIDQFMEGIGNFYDYEADLKTQGAIERQLSIIGEAINQL
nr:HepT-like ribonuclease domain-containing protein [Echinicola shivajiensis]